MAVGNARELENEVARIVASLGLRVDRQRRVARRIWGPVRHIDVVATDELRRRALGIECKFQKSTGTAEEKIPSTVQDIEAWPFDGIVCFEGEGFSDHMRFYLYSTGKGVTLDDLEDWLRAYFVL